MHGRTREQHAVLHTPRRVAGHAMESAKGLFFCAFEPLLCLIRPRFLHTPHLLDVMAPFLVELRGSAALVRAGLHLRFEQARVRRDQRGLTQWLVLAATVLRVRLRSALSGLCRVLAAPALRHCRSGLAAGTRFVQNKGLEPNTLVLAGACNGCQ